jgi:hypothetical protein
MHFNLNIDRPRVFSVQNISKAAGKFQQAIESTRKEMLAVFLPQYKYGKDLQRPSPEALARDQCLKEDTHKAKVNGRTSENSAQTFSSQPGILHLIFFFLLISQLFVHSLLRLSLFYMADYMIDFI